MITPAAHRPMDDPEVALLNTLIYEVREAIRDVLEIDKSVEEDAKADIAISALLNVVAYAIYKCCGSRGHMEEAQQLLAHAWTQYANNQKAVH